MIEILKVSKKLYRGPRPQSFKGLHFGGFTDVINLQSGAYEKLHNDQYEGEKASDWGMVEHNIPCSDVTPPTAEQVRDFLRIIQEAEGLVYVHCLHGKDRTGFLCAVYRMLHQHWTFKEAVKEMFEIGFHKMPYLWWLFELRTWSK